MMIICDIFMWIFLLWLLALCYMYRVNNRTFKGMFTRLNIILALLISYLFSTAIYACSWDCWGTIIRDLGLSKDTDEISVNTIVVHFRKEMNITTKISLPSK